MAPLVPTASTQHATAAASATVRSMHAASASSLLARAARYGSLQPEDGPGDLIADAGVALLVTDRRRVAGGSGAPCRRHRRPSSVDGLATAEETAASRGSLRSAGRPHAINGLATAEKAAASARGCCSAGSARSERHFGGID